MSRTGPYAMAVIFVGLFLVLPIAVGALDTGALSCTRRGDAVDCVYVDSLLGMERGRTAASGVTGARVEASRSRNGTSQAYRPVLIDVRGEVPLSSGFNYARGRHQEVVDRVQGFLTSQEPALALTQAPWGWEYVLGISTFFAVVGRFAWKRRAQASGTSNTPRAAG